MSTRTPSGPLHKGLGGGPLRLRGGGRRPARLKPHLHSAQPWPGPGLPSRATVHTRPVPATPGTASGDPEPRLAPGPLGNCILLGMRGARGQKPDSYSLENDSDSSRPHATVGRPPVQCRARPERLGYKDWGATGGPRNRYLTRRERDSQRSTWGRRPATHPVLSVTAPVIPPRLPPDTHTHTSRARSPRRHHTDRLGASVPQGGRPRQEAAAASAASTTSRPHAALQAGLASRSSAVAVTGAVFFLLPPEGRGWGARAQGRPEQTTRSPRATAEAAGQQFCVCPGWTTQACLLSPPPRVDLTQTRCC